MSEDLSPRVCPVCEERLERSSSKCFRCQTTLAKWWPLEDALRGIGDAAGAEDTRSGGRRLLYGAVVLIGAMALSLGFASRSLWQGGDREEEEAAAQVPLPVATLSVKQDSAGGDEATFAERRKAIHYRVQKGDSLWRVAAALTGRGADWATLWPDYRGRELRLQPGTVLEVPVARLESGPVVLE